MITEKNVPAAEKQTAAPRKMIKCPQKRGINLNMQEKQRSTGLTLLIGILLIALLAGSVAKFGVIDQYRRLEQAQSDYNRVHTLYRQTQEKLQDYDRVLLEYRTYSMDWISDEQYGFSTLVNRQEVLNLIEKEILPRGSLSSLRIDGEQLTLSMSGMTLDEISQMFEDIQQSPIVSAVSLDLASTENGKEASILAFSMRITLCRAEEGAK